SKVPLMAVSPGLSTNLSEPAPSSSHGSPQGNELNESAPTSPSHCEVASSYVVCPLLSFSSFWFRQAISLEPTAQARQEPKLPGRRFRINHLQRRSGFPAYSLVFIVEQFDQVADCTPGLRTDVSQGPGSFSAHVLVFVLQCPG